MASLPVLGLEGPPPMKRPRTDSDSGERDNFFHNIKGVWLMEGGGG